MNKNLDAGQAVELIRFKVLPENTEAFLEGRREVDEFTGTLKGYVGTEILKLSNEEFLLLIRWENEQAVLNAQKITANAPVISNWISKTAQFVSFETSLVEYEN